MFNVEGFLVDGNFNVKTTKWAVRIESFKEICFQSDEKNILVIMIDSDKNKRRKDEAKINFKRKDKIELVFDEEEDKQKFLFECRRLFFNINNQALPVRINK